MNKPDAESKFNLPNIPTLSKKLESKLAISKNHPPIEVLKILSLLQLQPLNHGKNIRLESATTQIVNSIHETLQTLDIIQLRKDLLKELRKDYREDPPDNFFSENIIYSNGNNIVYPGIFIDVVEILQCHINSLIDAKPFPVEFVKECNNAIILLLSIQTQIAESLNHTHRMFEESNADSVYLPENNYIIKHKEDFVFSFKDIKNICDKFQVPYNTIDSFVFQWKNKSLEVEDNNDNVLFQQPFIFVNGLFLLVMPTAIAHCLIQFIINKAKQYKITALLTREFAASYKPEIMASFIRMKWNKVKFKLPAYSNDFSYMHLGESIWKFDHGKFAYVTVLTENILSPQEKSKFENSFSKAIQKRIDAVLDEFKKEYEVTEIILMVILSKIGLVNDTFFAFREFKNSIKFISLTDVELSVLTREWKFDSLTLWKYLKYLTVAEKKNRFAPLTSPLALFHFYKNHSESFYHSDEKPYDLIHLEFDIAGNIRRKGLLKFDKLGISYGSPANFGFMQCIRKEEYYPVYISQDFYFGNFRTCLLKYSFPIWFEPAQENRKSDLYINAILYWLNEIYEDAKDYINQLGSLPLKVELKLHEQFYRLEYMESLSIYDDIDHSIPYKIDTAKRQISFTIPIEMVQFFSGSENRGERILIEFLLDAFGELIKAAGGKLLSKSEKQELLDKHIPVNSKKMLLLVTGDRDPKISDVDIPQKRYISDADISYILENQFAWLKLNPKTSFPLSNSKLKTAFLNKLVELHYSIVIQKLKQCDKEHLLICLMKKNESLLQARAFRHINYPAKLLCYSKYYDVSKEFSESEKDLIETSLSVRILIEFAALQPETGKLIISEDEIDIMLAHTLQIVNYASISDAIQYEIENPEITLLPSGRIGISKEFERNSMHQFRDQIYAEEIHSYTEEFKHYFKRNKITTHTAPEENHFAQKLKKVFQDEWGITLSEIDMVCHAICMILLSENTSVKKISEQDFVQWLLQITDLNESKVQSFIDKMKFLKRPQPLSPPSGFDKWEVHPWRFNRRLSYLHRPIISLEEAGKEYLLLSARHLITASENLISILFNGTLKPDQSNKKIIQLLAEINKIKGKEYRDEVASWLKENTNLKVYDYEIKIRPKGFFKDNQDKGDIDILAINNSSNIIYSIECKNTVQSKLTYDYRMEFDNYLGTNGKEGLINKHINRHIWLENNIEQVQLKLSLNEKPIIKSLVISKNILPLKHMKTVPIPVLSFYEIKTKQFTF